MFRCQVTGEVSLPHEKLHRVVVETRTVHHTETRKGFDGRTFEHTTGTGKQIVKEINVSAAGLLLLHNRLS
jgi:hypothetical protein